jgi:hypothetical protein
MSSCIRAVYTVILVSCSKSASAFTLICFLSSLLNAREFHADACPAREASRAKALWVSRRLQEEDVDVCFLLEVMGSQEAFTAETYGLRAMAKKIGYVV